EGRARGERMDGGAEVMAKARQCELHRAHPAPGDGLRLAHEHRSAGAGEGDRRRETVRPRSHHHPIRASRRHPSILPGVARRGARSWTTLEGSPMSVRVLTINGGSSTLKFAVFEMS